MTALTIFCLAKLRRSWTSIFISSTCRLTNPWLKCQMPHKYTELISIHSCILKWLMVCLRQITTGLVQSYPWISIHFLRDHEKSERNSERLVNRDLMMQTKQRKLLCEYFIINVWMVLAFCLDIIRIWKLYTKSRLILILLYNFSSWYWKILYLYIYLYI